MSVNEELLKSLRKGDNKSKMKIEQIISGPRTTLKLFSGLLSTRSSNESLDSETDSDLKTNLSKCIYIQIITLYVFR